MSPLGHSAKFRKLTFFLFFVSKIPFTGARRNRSPDFGDSPIGPDQDPDFGDSPDRDRSGPIGPDRDPDFGDVPIGPDRNPDFGDIPISAISSWNLRIDIYSKNAENARFPIFCGVSQANQHRKKLKES